MPSTTAHKAWVSGALTALVTLLLIYLYGESPDGPTLEEGLKALATSLATGAASWLATWAIPNRAKDSGGATFQAPPLAVCAAVALAVLTILSLAGCASTARDPALVATATCRAYAATLSSLAGFRAAGEIDDAMAGRINDVRAVATPLCTGAPPTDAATLAQLEDRLFDLLIIEQEASNAG
ncbi:hypothetical protein [Rhodospirillaceae bacterium SYSU D60014]|uniref:hypothetical protein n=1 Tax=Virgifigura deserti TaxID=2268457 RepID=UPI000E671752